MSNEINSLIQYRQKAEKKAATLFETLLPLQKTATEWNVLVIAAGSFPGYLPLLQQFVKTIPDLQQVNFTLIEPVKKWTDIFLQHFATLPKHVIPLKVTVSVVSQGIEDYLMQEPPKSPPFDLVYFEHAETMTLPILLAKSGMRSFRRVISFRKSLPHLAMLLKPNAMIIASAMSRHELTQLKTLLKFSLHTHSTLTTSPLSSYVYGGPFSAGLYTRFKQCKDHLPLKKSHAIRRSDNVLFLVMLISFVIYFTRFMQPDQIAERLLAIFLIGAQLFWHRPGISGLLIKIGLVVLLFLC